MPCDAFKPDVRSATATPDLVRGPVARPRDVHDARFTLHDHVVAGAVLLEPVSPKPEIEQ